MALVEYLYVDKKRLDSYFEQISSPVTYDKVPEWSANISLTGPGAGGKQARFARPYSTHEKISKLTKYLEEEGLVGFRRNDKLTMDNHDAFRLETCRAKRVFIPTKQGDSSLGALTLWISLMDRSAGHGTDHEQSYASGLPGNLYLLEDYRDDDPPYLASYSGFSLLDLLLGQGLAGLNYPAPSRYEDLPDLINLSGATDDRELRRFSVDPTVALSQLGAHVGPAREIRTLYRMRLTFMDSNSEPQFTIATFGYPIFVAAGTDTL